ncbi:DUF2793 domain-containing protein [Exilibacterium tricleocarpae]|uniref:DUF2793 domain-containing protein n=1 Tax=Exilibacterium tricleocarpae TaxID=2591008 RepID=A0A545U718_9GAMM|nr:DUF2793 domain-containing protein [Exilibacterium tricleocarpae]TQV85183.1 DUF2793 domain-containing protein [Exilibacterium tricleocarpae]
MPATQGPGIGLYYGWDFDESGWDQQMTTNLRRLDIFNRATVLDRNLSAPPAMPTDGDTYIVGPAPTGLWAGHENEIAVWRDAETVWEFYTSPIGKPWYIDDESVLTVRKVAGWAAGVAV